ncbi:hypothetical protein RZA67_13725 [Stenotrophomonas sp. C3(2023)]|uniref:hypothetical protein n=1 Tax=Stenotrophomonas sp. C3(2023) TaxID=3080277 RepID=UPI00293CAA72|nr:hypothetical protein [Stenotrophomonas sp. C3(2023)]MDV3469778.1 hypothetical protein [Stenotrophomonas sp. C3(2023)]
MRAELSPIPPVINVEAEVAYWREQHANGALGPGSFGHYVPWIKFACDLLLSQPHASDAQREEMFQTHYALQIMPRLSEAQARQFIQQCWNQLYSSSTARCAPPPQLRAVPA